MPKTYAGQFSKVERLDLTDPDFWVDVRTRLKTGDKEAAEEEMFRVVAHARESAGGEMDTEQLVATIQPNMAKYRRLLVQASLVDWNLTDEDGVKIPLDYRQLDDDDFELIYKFVDKANKKRTVAEQERFPQRG